MATIQFIWLVLTFNAVMGYASSGTHFVASCPWLRENSFCTAYISTSETLVKITINDINNNRISKTQNIFVGRKNPESFPLDKENIKHRQPIANYPVRVFKSDKSFRMLVITQYIQSSFTKTASLILTPKSNCYKSYYTMTAQANPFFTIFSFDYTESNIRVKFPASEQNFYLECFASESCTPEKTVSVLMLKYEAWYFTIEDYEAYLMNVLVTSNNPVCVVSGNLYEHSDSKLFLSTTSLKSSKTWGKIYIVPNIFETFDYYGISTFEIPFTYMIYNFNVSKPQEFVLDSIQVENNFHHSEYYPVQFLNIPKAYTADIPFGLYQISRYSQYQDIVNLIPVEQWTPSTLLVDHDFLESFEVFYYIITQSSKDNVNVSLSDNTFNTNNGFRIIWLPFNMTIEGKSYCFGKLKPGRSNGRVFVGNRNGRIMIYAVVLSSFAPNLFTIFPYDFYQGNIYQKNCNNSSRSCAHDGIDNDCDGYIDEETENGEDDDGDGLVDEDNIKPYSNGYWSPWAFICQQLCNELKYSVRVRTCLNRSHDGKLCEGESIQCNKKTCPKSCVSTSPNSTDCFCNAGCSSCERNIFECVSCKAGYRNTEHCLTKNPKGEIESQCQTVEIIRTEIKQKDEEKGERSFKIFALMWVCTSGLAVAALLLKVCFTTLLYDGDAHTIEDEGLIDRRDTHEIESSQVQEKNQSITIMFHDRREGFLHRTPSTCV